MLEQAVDIQMNDGIAEGYLYRPSGSGSWPGILMLTDAIGIRPAKRTMAQRLAALGYTVLMPNIFFRTGKPPIFSFAPNWTEQRTLERFKEISAPLTSDVMTADGRRYVEFLACQPTTKPSGMGVVGYCMSGAYALRVAAACPRQIAAAASFHGGFLATDAPDSPHTVLPRVQARLYFGHAVDDASAPETMVARLEEALRVWGGRFESEVYPGALHGWTVPGNAIYNEPQAERHFGKLKELFAAQLS